MDHLAVFVASGAKSETAPRAVRVQGVHAKTQSREGEEVREELVF
jgi:hypothetical protein